MVSRSFESFQRIFPLRGPQADGVFAPRHCSNGETTRKFDLMYIRRNTRSHANSRDAGRVEYGKARGLTGVHSC